MYKIINVSLLFREGYQLSFYGLQIVTLQGMRELHSKVYGPKDKNVWGRQLMSMVHVCLCYRWWGRLDEWCHTDTCWPWWRWLECKMAHTILTALCRPVIQVENIYFHTKYMSCEKTVDASAINAVSRNLKTVKTTHFVLKKDNLLLFFARLK